MIQPADAQLETTATATTAASQESLVSDSSQLGGRSALDLLSSSSNLSASTAPGTGLTSPASSTGLPLSMEVASAPREAAMAAAVQLNHVASDSAGRVRTPEPLRPLATGLGDGQLAGSGMTPGPMVVDTAYGQQLHQASKRTASGTVKPSSGEVSAVSAGSERMVFDGVMRSPTNGNGLHRRKISELSAQLKTRLSYAMVKVQHGWENRSLSELEQSLPMPMSSAPARIPMTPTSTHRASHHAQRASTSSINTAKAYDSPYGEYPRRYAHSPDGYGVQSPSSQPGMLRRTISSSSGEGRPASHSPRTYASFWAQHERNPLPPPRSARHAHHASTSTVTSVTPSLAPPAEVIPSAMSTSAMSASRRRSQHGRAPPTLSTSGGLGGPSKARITTPKTPRQNFLRMPSQQAEKDAVDTLMFMSSPNNSANLKHVSQQGSPLRGEFPVDIRG